MKVRRMADIKTVTIEDATFTIRMVPRSLFHPVREQMASVYTALNQKDGALLDVAKEQEVNRIFLSSSRDLVRLGLVSHSNIVGEDGKDVPFETEGAQVTTNLLDLYEVAGILHKLATEILHFNVLTEIERKN